MWRVTDGGNNWFFGIGSYLHRCGDALSQLINVAVFLSKNPNESLSGRSYREKHHWFWGKMETVINWLFLWFHKEHCKKAHESDVARASKLLKDAA